jgi:hypothetical protein
MLVNYFVELGNKLAPGGGFVIQFLGEARQLPSHRRAREIRRRALDQLVSLANC